MLSGQKITFTLSTRENIFLWSEKYKLSLLKASMYTTAKFYDAITDKREKEVVELIDKVF